MPNVIISISFSIFFTYVTIFLFHLHIVFISPSWFAMQELVQHTINFNSRQSTDKHVDDKGFQSHLQATFGKSYNGLVCQYNLSIDQMLSDVFNTNRQPFWTNLSAVLDELIWTASGKTAHSACARSTGDNYTSRAPDGQRLFLSLIWISYINVRDW